MNCSKCKEDNLSYHNYCSNDGENLNYPNKKLTLQSDLDAHCIECGSRIEKKENYCTRCGRMTSKVCFKNESSVSDAISEVGNVFGESTLNKVNFNLKNFNLANFTKIDTKGVFLSVALTIILTSIVIAILGSLSIPQNSELAYEMKYYQEMGYYQNLSQYKFKSFMTSLAVMNVPSITISLKMALVNIGKMSVAARTVIYPLIIGLFMYISTSVCLNKEKVKGKTLENSIAFALIYSVIMVIVGFIGSYNITMEEGTSLLVNINSVSLFMNSLFIAFIGSYLGISKHQEQSRISSLFKKSFNTILIGLIISTVVLGIIIFTKLNQGYNFSEMMNYYLGDNKFLLMTYLIIFVCIMGGWLFALSNFAGISILGFTSYNIISLSTESGMPIILFSVIPMILFILIGRKLKSIYGDNQIKLVGIFSGMYAMLMGVFAYFTKVTFSINAGELQTYINDFVYGIISQYSYDYAYTVQGYMEQLYNNLNSGVFIGAKGLTLIIASFIFSFIFVYIGYKIKKIEHI